MTRAPLPRTPTTEDFRALARSSPWLFRTLHFTAYLRDAPTGPTRMAEAWLDRDHSRVTVRSGGRVDVESGVPCTIMRLTFPGAPDATCDVAAADPEQELERRADGLVARRPQGWEYEHGDPMWQNYQWTAMLDPAELSSGVEVSDVRAVSLHGADAWSAICRPVVPVGPDDQDCYDPRCSCCPLLDTLASRTLEHGPEHASDPAIFGEGTVATTYLVHLSTRTGVVLDVTPLDGESGTSLSVRIHGVDVPLAPPSR